MVDKSFGDFSIDGGLNRIARDSSAGLGMTGEVARPAFCHVDRSGEISFYLASSATIKRFLVRVGLSASLEMTKSSLGNYLWVLELKFFEPAPEAIDRAVF
jgi:hypothetical protein